MKRKERSLDRARLAPADWSLNEVKIARINLITELEDELAGRGLPRVESTTVSDYAVRWLEGKAERATKRLKPKTARGYRQMLELWVLPKLGAILVQRLERMDIQDWCSWAEGRVVRGGEVASQATLNGAWRVLRMLVQDLCADYRMDAVHLLRGCRPLSVRSGVREERTLTREELHAVLGFVADAAPERYAEVATLAWTGIRAGALYALKPGDLDRERELLRIERGVSWGDHGPVVGTTKTGRTREVYAPPEIVSALDAHREAMVRSQHPGLASGLLFPASKRNKWGTWHRSETSLRGVFRQAETALGLDLGLGCQVFRRTFNTLLVAAGVSGELIRAMTGHQGPEMTQGYFHGGHPAKGVAVRLALHGEDCEPSM